MGKVVTISIFENNQQVDKTVFSDSCNFNAEEKTILYLMYKYSFRTDIFKILSYRIQSKEKLEKFLKR